MKQISGFLRSRRWPRNLLVAGLLLLLLALVAFALRTRILTGIGGYLVVEDRLQPSELIFVIAIARSENQPTVDLGLVRNETDISVGAMEARGVPGADITVLSIPGGVTSTFDEARVLRDYVDANGMGSVILVTSAFHTRRARWIFARELEGTGVRLEVAAAPQRGFDAGNWWQSEGGLITVNNEYIKLLFYLWKYR
jgi:hypothetical protein